MANESAPGTPAVFFDRDGTLIEDVGYCNDPATVCLFPGVREALLRLTQNGFKNVLITNQSGLGRGWITPEQFDAVQRTLFAALAPAQLDAVYHCADVPGSASSRRKPSPAMVLEATGDHQLDLACSYFVGDKAIDVECGRNAGVRTILVATGYGSRQAECRPDFRAKDVVEAVDFILKSPNA